MASESDDPVGECASVYGEERAKEAKLRRRSLVCRGKRVDERARRKTRRVFRMTSIERERAAPITRAWHVRNAVYSQATAGRYCYRTTRTPCVCFVGSSRKRKRDRDRNRGNSRRKALLLDKLDEVCRVDNDRRWIGKVSVGARGPEFEGSALTFIPQLNQPVVSVRTLGDTPLSATFASNDYRARLSANSPRRSAKDS